MEDDVLGINARAKLAIHIDAANLHLAERHGLRGQNVAHLGGADTEGDGAKSTVSGGVAVATGNRGAGLGDALLRSDNVNDALLAAGKAEIGDAEVLGVLVEFLDHRLGERIGKRRDLAVGRDDVIDGGEGAVGIGHFKIQITQHAKGLRAGDLMDEMRVNEELCLAIVEGADDVRVPDFFEECFAHDACVLVD